MMVFGCGDDGCALNEAAENDMFAENWVMMAHRRKKAGGTLMKGKLH